MTEALSTVAKRGVAVLVLAAVAYLVFQVVVGTILSLLWIVAAVAAVAAVIWAVRSF